MFIGHYAASFALKAAEKKAPLGVLFLAVQFVDILFFPLAIVGIEKFNLIENYTQSTHFELEYMPYTHSLVAAILWSLAVFYIYKNYKSKSLSSATKVAAVVALAVLSHWFLDLIVHTPDLPLFTDDSLKLGFGLWNNDVATYSLEAVLIVGSLIYYMRKTRSTSKTSKYGMPIFVVLLLSINGVNVFGPLSPESDIVSVSLTSLAAYFIFAGIAYWLDKNRVTIDSE